MVFGVLRGEVGVVFRFYVILRALVWMGWVGGSDRRLPLATHIISFLLCLNCLSWLVLLARAPRAYTGESARGLLFVGLNEYMLPRFVRLFYYHRAVTVVTLAIVYLTYC